MPRARQEGRRTVEVDAPQGLSVTAIGFGSSRRSGTSSTTRFATAPERSASRHAPASGTVELAVSDEGAGFPRDFLPRAFERFSRRRRLARPQGSTGLGLSLVAAIARSHGGSAQAANGPAGGAEVVLTLPA